MKIAALLCGIIASVIAWAASYFVIDLSIQFLMLWPQTISQQFLGLIAWHVFIALALIGGIVAVVSPVLGGLVLFASAAGWAYLGTRFETGFSPQVAVPLAFAAIGGLASFGATFRGVVRRRASSPRRRTRDADEAEREEALRFEPNDDLARAVDMRSKPPVADSAPPVRGAADAIVPVAARRTDGPPSGMSGLVVANAIILFLLTIGIAILLYSDYRSGGLTAAFSTLPFAPHVAQGVPSVAAAPQSEPVTPEVEETAAVTTPTIEEAEGADAADAEVRVASQPLDIGALPPQEWADPFAYCAAVRTADFPDRRYTGPTLTDAIAEALRVPVSSPPDRVKWRCADGALLGCRGFTGPSCAMTPSVTEMLEYCSQNPNAQGLLAPNGSWSCNETEPEIPAGQSWPVDARGFLPGAWVEIAPPPAPAG